jgi:hypothetical protein
MPPCVRQRFAPAIRVVAQRCAAVWPALRVTVAILLALGWTAWRFTTGDVAPRRTAGTFALILGTGYLLTMVTRLLLGLTALSHVRWFASPLPTVFHMVLAAYLLLYGRFHYVHGGSDR